MSSLVLGAELLLLTPSLLLAWAAFLALVAGIITPVLVFFCVRLLQTIWLLKRNTDVIRGAAEELRRNAAVAAQLRETTRVVAEAVVAAEGGRLSTTRLDEDVPRRPRGYA